MNSKQAENVGNKFAVHQDVLGLLYAHGYSAKPGGYKDHDWKSVIRRCESHLDSVSLREEPIRSIHHFACTGGTIMSKCLAALPNAVLLSEINPLSTMQTTQVKSKFAPTDLIFHLRKSFRDIDKLAIEECFLSGLRKVRDRLATQGRRVLIRDHAHSQFCTSDNYENRPTLGELIKSEINLLSVVTVRHPLDSFMSLKQNGWVHFFPKTLHEYSCRYIEFLLRYSNASIFYYETFTENPERIVKSICKVLDLPYHQDVFDLAGHISLSGDSGRSGVSIKPRPRREVSADLRSEIAKSASYVELCQRLGYNPDPDGSIFRV
jgi:hypothetical protein